MKGGIFALSENFMKILETSFLAIVLLSIFIALNQYQLINLENKVDRETLVVGDTVLSSCIAESCCGGSVIRGLLSECKIKGKEASNQLNNQNIDCLNYDKGIYIEIYNESNYLLHGFGDSRVCLNRNPFPNSCNKKSTTSYTIFPAAFNLTDSNIIPVTVKIFVGVV
jgi:hypothetical protein